MTSVQFYIYEGKPVVGGKLVGPSRVHLDYEGKPLVGSKLFSSHVARPHFTTAASGVRGALGVGASKPPPPVVAPA